MTRTLCVVVAVLDLTDHIRGPGASHRFLQSSALRYMEIEECHIADKPDDTSVEAWDNNGRFRSLIPNP